MRFRYPSSSGDILKGISFDVREGEIFGLLGPSGAGKSTTQKILVKLLEDYQGSIAYFGKDLKTLGNSYYEEVRLNFVRAMLNNPRVLFLDEVTNGLDPKNARIIKDMIAEFRDGGGTVFLTTHLMNDVEQLCDRVAFCVDGSLIEISTPRDLKLKYGKREVTVEYREGGNLASATFPLEGIGFNEEFQRLLQTKDVETIHSGETSMEEIFIIVTGVEVR